MRWHTVTACCLLTSLSLVSGQEAPVQATDEGSVWKDVVRLYEMARDKGEQVPKDVYEWARQDLQRYGTWEYRVVKVSAGAIEKTLNELGTERWECVWIEPAGKQLQLILKRPVRSYLRNLPLSQVLKLVPGAGSGDE
jgi:hypothetical protein